MPDDYRISINFLPVDGDIPAFRVYRKQNLGSAERPVENAVAHSLPVADDSNQRGSYWIVPTPMDGFNEYLASPHANSYLTSRFLFIGICDAARRQLSSSEYRTSESRFVEEISFVMQEHEEGQELLTIQPYYLRETKQTGCLVDFHFSLRPGIHFSKRVQQLSLSLDRNFRRNLDYYVDRELKIMAFLQTRRSVLESIAIPGASRTISLSKEFVTLPGYRLRSKVYVSGGNRESQSQFLGLSRSGPLRPANAAPHLLFAFRERDRQAARTLAVALRGSSKRERTGFPGFKALFKTDLTIDSNPCILPDLSEASFDAALARLTEERAGRPETLPVFVLPEGDDNGYLFHKARFAHAGIPTQVCTLPVIQDENALKWAIANIALQVFCKSGGIPWKVRPTQENTLIVGISQSHKSRETEAGRQIERYFAFSIMTDNSGLFQRIQVLGESNDQANYLDQLRAGLRQILSEASNTFSRVVLHTSFKLKHREVAAIQKTVEDAAATSANGACQFAVVKINHRSRFFGVNPGVNSLVPYEATTVRLGGGQYLLWFEGLFPDKPTVTKAYPRPTHVEFLRLSQKTSIPDDVLLQDLVNLSGANWRGFNAKSAPVSVFYCHLVADFVHDFYLADLPLPKVQDIRPWFL